MQPITNEIDGITIVYTPLFGPDGKLEAVQIWEIGKFTSPIVVSGLPARSLWGLLFTLQQLQSPPEVAPTAEPVVLQPIIEEPPPARPKTPSTKHTKQAKG